MMAVEKKIRIHIKNNRWREGSFPNTPEGEKVLQLLKKDSMKLLLNFLISRIELKVS